MISSQFSTPHRQALRDDTRAWRAAGVSQFRAQKSHCDLRRLPPKCVWFSLGGWAEPPPPPGERKREKRLYGDICFRHLLIKFSFLLLFKRDDKIYYYYKSWNNNNRCQCWACLDFLPPPCLERNGISSAFCEINDNNNNMTRIFGGNDDDSDRDKINTFSQSGAGWLFRRNWATNREKNNFFTEQICLGYWLCHVKVKQ